DRVADPFGKRHCLLRRMGDLSFDNRYPVGFQDQLGFPFVKQCASLVLRFAENAFYSAPPQAASLIGIDLPLVLPENRILVDERKVSAVFPCFGKSLGSF